MAILVRRLREGDDLAALVALSRAFFAEYEAHHDAFFRIDELREEEIRVAYRAWLLMFQGIAQLVVLQGRACSDGQNPVQCTGRWVMPCYYRVPVAVHVFFLRDEQVLLLRRQNTGFEDGKLSVVAGHVEAGESVTRAALREIREEVGLALPAERLRVVGVMHRKSDDERIDFFLACRLDGGQPAGQGETPHNREPAKCSELVWADLERLPEDTIPYVRAALANYRDGVWFEEFGWA